MHKKIYTLLMMLFWPVFASAQEANMPDELTNAEQVNVSDGDEFREPNQSLGEIKTVTRPQCSDADLYAKILETVNNYMSGQENTSILAKRRQILMLKNLQSFEEVPVENFLPEEDVNVANALITLKINQRIPNDKIIVCRQKNAKNKAIYVVIYEYFDNYKGNILNLDKYNVNLDELTFIYP